MDDSQTDSKKDFGIHSRASKNERDKKSMITEEMDFVQRKIGALELEIGFRKARGEWAR